MKPEEKLLKAKGVILLGGSPFLSTIMINLKHKIVEDIPTACTDGISVKYGKEFMETLSIRQLAWVICHETWHVAFNHIDKKRIGDRDKKIWNYAGDYVINGLIWDSFERPDIDMLHDYKYANLTTEEVYDLIYKDPPDIDMSMDIEASDSEEVQDAVKEILVKASTVAKAEGYGDIPAEIGRWIDALINPKIPWSSILLDYLNQKVKDDYSWKRPSRRSDVYLPSLYSEGIGDIAIAIDTSGSVTDEDLKFMLSEIQYIADTFNPSKLTIIDCDTDINNIYEIEKGDSVLGLQFTGGGGTSCKPILDYGEEHKPAVLIYFTDGYMYLPEVPPSFDMVWIIYGNPDFTLPHSKTIFY